MNRSDIADSLFAFFCDIHVSSLAMWTAIQDAPRTGNMECHGKVNVNLRYSASRIGQKRVSRVHTRNIPRFSLTSIGRRNLLRSSPCRCIAVVGRQVTPLHNKRTIVGAG
jgi:hypothetical protein